MKAVERDRRTAGYQKNITGVCRGIDILHSFDYVMLTCIPAASIRIP